MFTLRKFTNMINQMNIYKRNLMWIDTEIDNPNILKLGITDKTVQEFGKINNIILPKENNIKINEELIIIENNFMIKNYIAPYDCIIIERNNILNLNISLENNDNWIIKIIPVVDNYIEKYYY